MTETDQAIIATLRGFANTLEDHFANTLEDHRPSALQLEVDIRNYNRGVVAALQWVVVEARRMADEHEVRTKRTLAGGE